MKKPFAIFTVLTLHNLPGTEDALPLTSGTEYQKMRIRATGANG
jgi:hypothetical protein